MRLYRFLFVLICAGAALGQTPAATDTGGYSGPAVLSTAGRPVGKYFGEPINFRYHLGVMGSYTTGLTQPITDEDGNLLSQDSWGAAVMAGLYGAKNGPRDTLGGDFLASYRAYVGADKRRNNGADFRGTINYARQASLRTSFQLSASARSFGYSYGGLYQPVIDDPLDEIAPPEADGFDGRTRSFGGMAGVAHMLNRRVVLTAFGGAYFTDRRSSALMGGESYRAAGQLSYLLGPTSQIGAVYAFGYNHHRNNYGQAWISNFGLSYVKMLSARWTFAANLGAYRAESERLQQVPLDPVLAAIVGQATVLEPFHRVLWGPSLAATIARQFRTSSLSFYYRRGMTPGNAIFTTSTGDVVGAGYSYTGVRKLHFRASVSFFRYKAIMQSDAIYNNIGLSAGLSYRLKGPLHFTAMTHYRTQEVEQGNFDRDRFYASVGLTFSPGARPVALF